MFRLQVLEIVNQILKLRLRETHSLLQKKTGEIEASCSKTKKL